MTLTPLALAFLLCAAGSASAQKDSASHKAPAKTGAAKTVWPDEGPRTWAPRPTVPEITANDLRTRLYQISDDSMQGRRVGELGDYKVTSYIASEFKRLGLKPAGDNGTYFQEIAYGPATFDESSSRLAVLGAKFAVAARLAPDRAIRGERVRTRRAAGFQQRCVSCTPDGGDDTSVVPLDPAVFKGKVAVFSSNAAGAGLIAAGRGAARVCCAATRCRISLAPTPRRESRPPCAPTASRAPVRAEVAAVEAADVAAQAAVRHATHAQIAAGAVGVLIITTDSIPASPLRTEHSSAANSMQSAVARAGKRMRCRPLE